MYEILIYSLPLFAIFLKIIEVKSFDNALFVDPKRLIYPRLIFFRKTIITIFLYLLTPFNEKNLRVDLEL